MNKKTVLKEFKKLNIRNTLDLYDFLMNNSEATINKQQFNLKDSKDVMNFIYMFVSALNWNSVRLNFSKEGFEHWFLAFTDGENWFYYETALQDIAGQFSFLSYNELIFFITNKLNAYHGNENDNYVLKDFQKDDDIESDGVELLVNDSLKLNPKYEANVKKGISFMPGSGSNKGIKLFVCGFGLTFVICMVLLGIAVYIMRNQ